MPSHKLLYFIRVCTWAYLVFVAGSCVAQTGLRLHIAAEAGLGMILLHPVLK